MTSEATGDFEPDDQTEALLPGEEEELRSMRSAPELPGALEDRVVRTLVQSGRIRRHVPWLRIAACFAAVVLLFAGGWMVGRSYQGPQARNSGNRFLILLQAGGMSAADEPPHGSAEEENRVREYVAWMRGLRADGHLLQGERLADSGRELNSDGENDAQWSLADGTVVGFFVVSAPDLAQAVELARGCPHLRHGGRIEVRPIDTP
jgi:hypothetical protein